MFEYVAGRLYCEEVDLEEIARSARTPSASERTVAPSSKFSVTVRLAKMWRPSGTSAMPCATTSSSAMPASDLPPKTMLPLAAGTIPAMADTSEVLPAPLGPTMLMISPSPTARSTPRTAVTAP